MKSYYKSAIREKKLNVHLDTIPQTSLNKNNTFSSGLSPYPTKTGTICISTPAMMERKTN